MVHTQTDEETTVRYMVMHYQTQDMEDGVLPSPEQQAAIGEHMREAAMSRRPALG